MKSDLVKEYLKALKYKKDSYLDMNKPLELESVSGVRVKKINNRSMHYGDRHRGNWFKPEYDLTELQIAQDVDSYIFKAIQKKVQRFVLAGWEIVGKDQDTVNYIKRRLKEIELVSGMPLDLLMTNLVHDLARYSNCAWVKVRNKDASTGNIRNINGKEIEPVAGYFILPFETLWFKTKRNGEIKKVMQKIPNTGETKEFAPQDVIHFYTNKKPGFVMGTPELLPVLEDIALLRRLEENVENMIDANLHPLFHYKVGNDAHPERYSPDGVRETDLVRQTIEYMPSGGIFVSDHRHSIDAIGSEGKALKIEEYIAYFKKRVFAGLGVSPIDMGEGDTANRSTANTLSKIAIQDVEALQRHIKTFFESYIINELLAEGGFVDAIVDPDKAVQIKFGTVDKEDKSKEENQIIQLWLNNLINEDEARKRLGERPMGEEDKDKVYYKLYQEPLALIKAMAGAGAASALARSPSSNITEKEVKKEEVIKRREGNRGEERNPAKNLSNNISRPQNQTGIRTAPKFNSDLIDFILNEDNLEKIIEKIEKTHL